MKRHDQYHSLVNRIEPLFFMACSKDAEAG